MIRSFSPKVLWPALGAILSLSLAGCGGQSADTNAATDSGASKSTDTTTQAPASNAAPAPPVNVTGKMSSNSTASFKDAAATWKQISAASAALDKVIKSKNLKTVHEAAFKVRDIVRTLPAKSSGLAPDKQKTLASQVKNVDGLAKLLDEAGDANKLKETQENQAGLKDALDIIKGLYPAGALG
jgi:hypothetical protein